MKNSYKRYQNARDAAWKVLLDCGISSLPVRPSEICRHYEWVLATYEAGAHIIDVLGLQRLPEETDGFCTISGNHTYIFYNDALPVSRKRFTVAHEIGHIVLGHVGNGMATVQNREPTGRENPLERQANQFAARLLAPACVLHALGATTPEEIQHLCGLSQQAARYRAARLRQLEERNRFYASPLERRVLANFQAYIKCRNQL